MTHSEVVRQKFLGIQVCSDETDMERLTEWVNTEVLCGTTVGWVLSRRPEVAPVECENDPSRTHYVFDC